MDVTYHEPVNLGNPQEYTIEQFAYVIREKIDSSISINYFAIPNDDPKQRKPEIETAKKLLNWHHRNPLDLGIDLVLAELFENKLDTCD